MQELLLHASLPHARQTQLLHILAGVTGTQPTSHCLQILLYDSRSSSDPPPKNGKAKLPPNNGKPTVHKLIRELVIEDGEVVGATGGWRLRVEDTPLAGVNTGVVSRAVTEREVVDGELERFREGGFYYKYLTQHLLPHHRVINHPNTIITLSQPLTVPEGTGALEPLDAPLPVLSDCQTADPARGYMVEACVRVEDASNSALMAQGTNELLDLKRRLDGVVELKGVERLWLDSRVKPLNPVQMPRQQQGGVPVH